MKQETYKQLISGEQRGTAAGLVRMALGGLGLTYSCVARLRNSLYQKRVLRSHAVPVPVISIGNLTAGGTGKTPLVIWLAHQLSKQAKVAVLTRGYKTKATESSSKIPLDDEPALLARACPEVSVIVNPNRVAGAREAIRDAQAEILILDDGFQHRRLQRDLDLITVDATCPFGYGRQLPAGLLREPLTGLRRAQAAILTHCDQVASVTLEEIVTDLLAIHPGLVIAQTRHQPTHLCASQSLLPATELQNKRIFAFCGLGNPEAFYSTLRSQGARLVGTLSFDDHHHCTSDDLRRINDQALRVRADWVVTTEKNWFSLPETTVASSVPWVYLAVELAFETGGAALTDLIKTTLAPKTAIVDEANGDKG